MIGGVIGFLTVLACIAFLLRRQLAHWEDKRRPHTTRPATQYLDKHLYRGGTEFQDRIFGRPADSEREMKPDHAESGGEQLAAP